MKSKKSKQKEIKNKNSQKEKGINEIEKDILSSPKNINLVNKLIELFINNIESKEEQKLREIINSFKNILNYYLMDDSVKSSTELVIFLNNKLQLIYKIILDIEINEEFDESFLSTIFNIFHELINFVPKDKLNSLFNELISKLIFLEKDISNDIINNFYEKFNSIYFYNYINEYSQLFKK